MLSHLFSWFRAAPRTAPRRRYLPRCESLEDRALPSCGCSGTVFAGKGAAGLPRIVNGTPTGAFRSVGKVGDHFGGYCTGTLIAPRLVLTAAHCSEDLGDTEGRFFLGGQRYTTVQIFVHPHYRAGILGKDGANDLAIWQLNRDVVGVTPSPINRQAPRIGQYLALVGFGAGGTALGGHTDDFGIKRVGYTPIDGLTPRLITWDFDRLFESNTAPGDSGGPAFLLRDGVYFVAGVTSGGDKPNAGLGDHSFNTRVDAYQSWIDSILSLPGGPPPDDDHGDSLGTATPLVLADSSGQVSGTVNYIGDRDLFRFKAAQSGYLVIRLVAASGSDLDPVLAIHNGKGKLLALNDDFFGRNSRLKVQVNAGWTYFVRASGYGETTGDYEVQIVPFIAPRRR